MKTEDIIRDINIKLAGELLSTGQLIVFINASIDEVNTRLNTKFPILKVTDHEYTAIPDKYIRTVIIPGAAFKFYIMDEEGAAVSPKYEEDFLKGLFYMERDYLPMLPDEYVDDDIQGHVRINGLDDGGLVFDGSVFII